MSDINSLIQMIKSQIQQNAQAALPVIPNNGNPNGANNMPTNSASSGPPLPVSGYAYPWMAPSPSMDAVQQMLSQPLQQPQVPALPVPVTSPVLPSQQLPQLPVLPQRNHEFQNMRQQMRAEGDFSYMPKLGQNRIASIEPQQLLPPVMPMRGQGF